MNLPVTDVMFKYDMRKLISDYDLSPDDVQFVDVTTIKIRSF